MRNESHRRSTKSTSWMPTWTASTKLIMRSGSPFASQDLITHTRHVQLFAFISNDYGNPTSNWNWSSLFSHFLFSTFYHQEWNQPFSKKSLLTDFIKRWRFWFQAKSKVYTTEVSDQKETKTLQTVGHLNFTDLWKRKIYCPTDGQCKMFYMKVWIY